MDSPAPGRVDLSFLDPPTEPGDLGRIAHYRVLGVLGVGGMGVVLRAEDAHLRRTVALKVMRREFVDNYTSRERFLLEARAAASLQSDNIVTVYQVGMHNDVPYLAMQYLTGETLDARMEREPPLSMPDALLITRQVAAGLACAHDRGLVHRDVKPANIWLETDPHARGAIRAKLLDFGLARVVDSGRKLTNMGQILGTPQFMAPEQACGVPVDGRADLFSLGSILYTLVTGHLPFAGPTTAALLVAIVSADPTPARHLTHSLPGEIDDLLARLLAKSPDERPATAQEVVDALDEVLTEYSLPAPRSGTIGPSSSRIPFPSHPTPVSLVAQTCVMEAASDDVRSGFVNRYVPPPAARRPRGWRRVALELCGFALVAAAGVAFALRETPSDPAAVATPVAAAEPIKVGVLFAKGGELAAFERPLADATMLAIDEVNATGGVLGRPIVVEAVGPDRPGDAYVDAAAKLLRDPQVKTIFGTASSGDRRSVLPEVERANGVLFYAPAYEGMERSARAVYLGPTAAQQLVPALEYFIAKGTKRIFVVGSEDVYSYAALELANKMAKGGGAEVVGHAFFPFGSRDFDPVAKAVAAGKPDLVLNTLRGGSAIRLLKRVRDEPGFNRCPVLHLHHLEDYDLATAPADRAGDYVAGCFLESTAGLAGARYAAAFRARYGPARRVTDSAASAYSAVRVWAAAAEKAKSVEPDAVLDAVNGLSVQTPVGDLVAGPDRHFALPLVVSRYHTNGTLQQIHRKEMPSKVYPDGQTADEWDRVLMERYYQWGQRWSVLAGN